MQLRQDHHELVATQPRHRVVVAHALADAAGRFDEEQVAGLVALGFIHLLETVQVDEEQADHGLVALGLLDLPLQAVVEEAPVGQLGEVVVVGLGPDQVVGPLLLGDVGEQDDAPVHRAVVTENGADGDPGDEVAAVGPPAAHLALPAAAGLHRCPHVAVGLVVEGIALEQMGLPAGHVLIQIAGDLTEGRVDGQHAVVGVGDHHRLRGVGEDGGGQVQLLLGHDPFGDVPVGAAGAQEAAACTSITGWHIHARSSAPTRPGRGCGRG
jgi:hypothetical protein